MCQWMVDLSVVQFRLDCRKMRHCNLDEQRSGIAICSKSDHSRTLELYRLPTVGPTSRLATDELTSPVGCPTDLGQ